MNTVRWHLSARTWRIMSAAAVLVLVPVVAAAADPAAGAPATCGHLASDFNGDGYADLATTATGNPETDAIGTVQIDYGSAAGINPAHTKVFKAASPGMPTLPHLLGFGGDTVSGNFNGDCYADLAIGMGGAVVVLYGSSTGLSTAGSVAYVSPESGAGDGFGGSVVSGDFNHDGFADLAVGAPAADRPDTHPAKGDEGAVYILAGAAGGLGAPSASASFSEDSPGIDNNPHSGDHFGEVMASGDFDGDGYADLAITMAGHPKNAPGGAIEVLRGSSAGLTTTGAHKITQATPGVPGADENGDGLGGALAVGDVNGDGRDDLVAAVPGESVGSVETAGDIAYFPGTATGITGAGALRFSLASAGVPGTVQPDGGLEMFVAVGNLNGDGHAEVIFSSPLDLPGQPGGSAIVLPGTSSGPTGIGARRISQATAGVPGEPEADDRFGTAMIVAKLHGPGPADLVIGAEGEDGHGLQDNGYAVVIPGSPAGATGAGSVALAQFPNDGGPQADVGFGFTFG